MASGERNAGLCTCILGMDASPGLTATDWRAAFVVLRARDGRTTNATNW